MASLTPPSTRRKRPWYSRAPVLVAAVLLFPPLGLFLVWRFSDWHTTARSFALAWAIIFLVAGLAAADGVSRSYRPAANSPARPSVTLAPTPSPPPTIGVAVASATATRSTTATPLPATATPAPTATATPALVWFDAPAWMGRSPSEFAAELGEPSLVVALAPGAVQSAPTGGERRVYQLDWGVAEVVFEGGTEATGLYLVPGPEQPADADEALRLFNLPTAETPSEEAPLAVSWESLGGYEVILTSAEAGGPIRDLVLRARRATAGPSGAAPPVWPTPTSGPASSPSSKPAPVSTPQP